MSRFLMAVLFAFLFTASGCSLPRPLAAPARAQNGSTPPAKDFVKPGDVIKLYVWREEDMTHEFIVPPTGIVMLPLIGETRVTHLPKAELRDSIIAAIQVYRRNPSIEITFLKRISILGAVNEPNVYNVDESMTVATALALAGGATREGKQDEVQLLRGGELLRAEITRRQMIADLPLESGDQLYVPEKGWIARNSTLVASLISGAVSVAVAILVQK